MAFEKRNWLARIGTGLNKFLIGDKDSQGKQTLTNAPDSVTQQGDVISADNLNDLEERIATAISSIYNTLAWTKAWVNPSPTSDFATQTVSLDTYGDIMLLAYYEDTNVYSNYNSLKTEYFVKNGARFEGVFKDCWISADGVSCATRGFYQGANLSQLTFENAKSYDAGTQVYDDIHSNDLMIPVAIYFSYNIQE